MHKLRYNIFILLLMIPTIGLPYWAGEGTMRLGKQSPHHGTKKNFVKYVNPFCGTVDNGETFPGASAPFGMIQWSSDTGPNRRPAGYKYADTLITGFSLDHLSGAGCPYACNFGFVPLLDTGNINPPIGRAGFLEPFSHENEVAKPGYYSVKLNSGIKVELTTTLRTGFGRFIYPAEGNAVMVINASSNVNGTSKASVLIDPEKHSISGSVTGGHFCGFPDVSTIYFYAVFDKPFLNYGTWNDAALHKNEVVGKGKSAGAFVKFNLSAGRTVLAKVAISYVSTENAKLNLEAENPLSEFTSKEFDKAVAQASEMWNSWLNRIQVSGGSAEQLRTFYTMMYHTLLAPTVCSDVNNQYMGYDGIVHTTENGRTQYANFSGWDIYRSECQLLAVIAPEEASDMAQSLLTDYQQGGAFPRWGVPNEDSGVMIGDPAAPIIAGFYAFGAKNFDAVNALAGLVRAAIDPSVKSIRSHISERDALSDYLRLGYVPEDQSGGNVSMTLEYASADFAVSQLAAALGDTANSIMLLKHAQNWKNLFNPETKYFQMKRRDGTWVPASEDSIDYFGSGRAYVEGSAEQYVWMVPFNLKGLIDMMGGKSTATARLNTFFTELNGGFKSQYAFLGNEPCLGTPWIYCFLGKPYLAQQIIRRAVTELYSAKPAGYPGNDDLGEMSSWYIFSALGMYPELPGSDVLVLGSPLFPKAVLHLQNGDVTITAKGVAENAPYVRSLTVNGNKWNKPWIHFKEISNGGTMIYDLGKTPNTKWGSSPEDAPPSYQ